MALIDLDDIRLFLGIADSDDSNDDRLTAIASAACTATETWCDRIFESASYTEYLTGNGRSFVRVHNYPITAISRVAVRPETALQIVNGSSANQRANVALSPTTLTLNRWASGVQTTNTLSLATYVTIDALATAITALGNGWSASSMGSYGLWPSADLKTVQGALSASTTFGPAELQIYAAELSLYRIDEETGTIRAHFYPEFKSTRVDYTGGYATIPGDLKQGVLMVAQAIFAMSQKDPTLLKERIGDYSYTLADFSMDMDSPVFSGARALLSPYKRIGAL